MEQENMSFYPTLVGEAKEILDKETYVIDGINKVLQYVRGELKLNVICIRQRISRPRSLRIVYECSKNNPTKRINQTITFSETNWDYALKQYKTGHYLYYYDTKTEPMNGVIEKYKPESILQIPFFSDGIFKGTLDFIDFEHKRQWSPEDIEALQPLCTLIFQALDAEKAAQNIDTDRDYITGMRRYEAFIENIDRIISEGTNGSRVILLICSDIHHFKLVNENYGYRKGDELLRLYAREIQKDDRTMDACHIYSDNFIAAYQLSNPDYNHVCRTVNKMHQKLSLELQKCCPDNRIRICSGLYFITDNSIDASTAISYANIARKHSKELKGQRCVLFSLDMIKDMKWQAYINKELPRAIENHNLQVFYQPKVSCSNNHLFGAEALVRWKKDDGSYIYPDQFIPEFESNGNIVQVDFYVYEEVFRYLHNRLENGLPVVPVSMNVSRFHLENNTIIPFIRSLMEKYDVPAKYLEFELTENIYMNTFEPASEFIDACHEMGIAVSMDDFGSGYSSLNMISSLPIDTLKIDRIFMKHDSLKQDDKIVLNSVIQMAKNLRMNVLCEGVETEEQMAFLREAGCDIVQGYFYGKPMCQQDFDTFIQNSSGTDHAL